MDPKKRYCPFCGSKTNDHTCEICGRNTRPMDMLAHEKELDLVKDDICMDQHEEKTRRSTSSKRPALHMHEGEHPYYEEVKKKEPFQLNPENIKKGFTLIVVAFIIIVSIVTSLFDNFNEEEPESYIYFQDYATYHDEAPENLKCEVKREGAEDVMVVNNDSDEFLTYELRNEKEEMIRYISYMQPHSTRKASAYNEKINQCKIVYDYSYSLDYHKPDVEYHIEETDDEIIYQLDQSVSEEALHDILQYTLAGYAQGNYSGQMISIEIAQTQAYRVSLDMEEHHIYVYLEALDDYPEMDDFDFEMTTY